MHFLTHDMHLASPRPEGVLGGSNFRTMQRNRRDSGMHSPIDARKFRRVPVDRLDRKATCSASPPTAGVQAGTQGDTVAGAESHPSPGLSTLLTEREQQRLLHDDINVEALRHEVKMSGYFAAAGKHHKRGLEHTRTMLSMDAWREGDGRSTVDSEALSPIAQALRAAGGQDDARESWKHLRGAAQSGGGEEDFVWGTEEGSGMAFALAPEFRGPDFDEDFYHLFASGQVLDPTDLDACLAASHLSAGMFPHSSERRGSRSTAAFASPGMNFQTKEYSRRRLRQYGKWYVKDRSKWAPHFHAGGSGVDAPELLDPAERKRKELLLQQAQHMHARLQQHDIAFIFRDAVRKSAQDSGDAFGKRMPLCLQDLPEQREGQEGSNGLLKLKRTARRLRAANALRQAKLSSTG